MYLFNKFLKCYCCSHRVLIENQKPMFPIKLFSAKPEEIALNCIKACQTILSPFDEHNNIGSVVAMWFVIKCELLTHSIHRLTLEK